MLPRGVDDAHSGMHVSVASNDAILQGRTGRLEQLPKQLLEGQRLLLGSTAIGGFLCSVERDTVMWSLSFKAPQPRAAELNAVFKDPAAAQVSHTQGGDCHGRPGQSRQSPF